MRSGARDIFQNDDAAPVDMLAALFEARGWPCKSLSEEEIKELRSILNEKPKKK